MKRATLLSVLVCLSLGVAAVSSFMRKAERGMQRLSLSHVNTARIDHIQITGDSAIELFKDGERWRTESGREVDPEAIDGVFRAVVHMQSSDMVQQDEAAQEAVGLRGNTSTRVRLLKQTQVLADFVIGQSDMMASWVREADRSFKVAHMPTGAFRRPAQSWLQRRLFAATAEDVAQIEVQIKGHPSYILARGSDGFEVQDKNLLPKGFRFDADAAAHIVQNVVEARAEAILDSPLEPEKTGLSAPELQFRVKWTEAAAAQRGAAQAQLQIGKLAEDGTSYAQVVDRPALMTLPSYVVQALRRPADSLRDTTLMQKFALQDVAALTLRDGVKQMTARRDGADAWVLEGADKAKGAGVLLDRGKILGRLRQIMGVHGAELAKVSPAKAGFGKTGADITVTMADKTQVQLRFGRQSPTPLSGGAAGYYVQGTGDDKIYILQRGIRNNLLAMGTSLASSATNQGLSALGPDALQNLPTDVRRAVEAQMAKEASGQAAR